MADDISMSEGLHATADEEEETPLDRAMVLLADGSGGGQLTIYALSGKGREYCGRLTPEQFEQGGLDLIAERWGAGEYEIQVRGPNPRNNGRLSLLARQRATIKEGKPGISVTHHGNSGEVGELARALIDGQTRQMELLQAIANKPAPPAADPLQMMTAMLGLMGTMRTALGLDKPAAAPPPSQLTEILETMRALKTAAPELLGVGEPPADENLTALAKPIIDMIASQMQQQQRATSGAVPVVAVPPSLAGQAAGGAPPASQHQQETDPMSRRLLAFKSVLLTRAKAGVTGDAPDAQKADECADYVYDNAPDWLLDVMVRDDWWTMLAQYAPEFAPHQAFLDAVRARTLELIAENDDGGQGPDHVADPTHTDAAR